MNADPRLLLLETSHRQGWVALAEGDRVLASLPLEEARRHARDLVPHTHRLLEDRAWKVRDLHGVVVSIGPGSYTGLRVGLMAAKTLAYAVGCAMLPLETFAILARQAPPEVDALHVLADAQQGKVYHQAFRRSSENFLVQASSLHVVAFEDWCGRVHEPTWVSGPALEALEERLPASARALPRGDRLPRPETAALLGLERWRRGDRADPLVVEPLYLRPSNAEENWERRRKT